MFLDRHLSRSQINSPHVCLVLHGTSVICCARQFWKGLGVNEGDRPLALCDGISHIIGVGVLEVSDEPQLLTGPYDSGAVYGWTQQLFQLCVQNIWLPDRPIVLFLCQQSAWCDSSTRPELICVWFVCT